LEAAMTDEAEAVRLLYRADWTQLRLQAQISTGSTVLVAPGKRYRFERAGYITGCDGTRPWQLSDEDEDEHDDGETRWISGPEPPLADLLCPAWMLTGSRLEVRGRTRACGRDALHVVVTPRPTLYERNLSNVRNRPAEAVVDGELGILLRLVQPGPDNESETTEFVTADFDPDIDPEQFMPPVGSLRGESFGEVFGSGNLGWRAVKTAAGLAAGGLGLWARHGPKRPDQSPPGDGSDLMPGIPAKDPAPEVSSDGLPVGPPVPSDVLSVLQAGGPAGFSARMHEWMDFGALASQTPAWARQAGFGGLGYLMDVVSDGPGAVQQSSTLRIAGPRHYQVDRSHQPRNGPVTFACDGEQLWKVYADKITIGHAEPLPDDIGELADPSWLLQCWLAGGESVTESGRAAYRLSVTRRHDYPSPAMWFRAVVAVLDAEIGCIVRLTSYIGTKAVRRLELENLLPAAGDFHVDLPADLPVTDAGRFDDFTSHPRSPGPPPTLGGIIAREAAAGAARAARNLLGRLGPRDPV
jgi:hypothetical protein